MGTSASSWLLSATLHTQLSICSDTHLPLPTGMSQTQPSAPLPLTGGSSTTRSHSTVRSVLVLSSPSPSSSPCSVLPLRSTSCFGATPPCSSDPSLVPPSLVSPCGATTRLTNSVIP